MTLSDCVEHYIREFRDQNNNALNFYKNQRTLVEAIAVSAECTMSNGRRHSHQRRIPGAVLREAGRQLNAHLEAISMTRSFEELHAFVGSVIGPIHGIGELTIYDISHRIGAHLGFEPQKVYLHAGTRTGALALGLTGMVIEKEDLPTEFKDLSAAEIEDFLCIYKDQLRGNSSQISNCSIPASLSSCTPSEKKPVRGC